MRKTLLFTLALLLSTVMFAQNRAGLIQESFNGSDFPAGWSIQGLGNGSWSISSTNNAGGTPNELYLYYNPSFNGVSRIVMNPVDLTNVEEVVVSETPDEVSDEELMAVIKGPDFPTEGIILGLEGIKQAYTTGRGKITVRAETEIEEKILSDVTEDKWFAPFVYAASEYGIINGITEKTFAPDKTITREDAALILYRALSKKGVSFNESLGFSDNAQISDYAKTAVGSLTAGEILKGDNGLFRPKDSLSRAETVTMLSRISGYIK